MRHTHYDALSLTLDIKNELYDLELLFWQFHKSFNFEENTQRDKNYKANIFLKYDNLLLGYLDYSYHRRQYISHLRINKRAIYMYPTEVSLLLRFLMENNLNARPKYFEVTIDTDDKKEYNKILNSIKSNKLIQPKNFHIYMGQEIYRNNTYIPKSDQTFYFRHYKKSKRDIYLRLENKTKVIESKPEDEYILDYLKKKGLNIEKQIYRFELVFTELDAFKSSRNSVYYSNVSMDKKPRFQGTVHKHKKKIEQFEKTENIFNFADPEIEKSRKIVKEFTIDGVTYHELNLDFTKIYDEEYLLAFFQYSAPKIINNLFKIIDEKHTNTFILPERVTRETIKEKFKSKLTIPDIDDHLLYNIFKKYSLKNQTDANIVLGFLNSIMGDPNKNPNQIIAEFKRFNNRR